MFQHDMAYGDFKDLTRRTASEHLIMLKILNMMDMNADLFQWFIHFLINKLLAEPLPCN